MIGQRGEEEEVVGRRKSSEKHSQKSTFFQAGLESRFLDGNKIEHANTETLYVRVYTRSVYS